MSPSRKVSKQEQPRKPEEEIQRGEEIELDEDDHRILDDIWKERQEETRKKLEEARARKNQNDSSVQQDLLKK